MNTEPHLFIRLKDTDSCEICGQQQAEHPVSQTPGVESVVHQSVLSDLQVTRLTRQVNDGRWFIRTGEKRQLQRGDWHWCDGAWDAPQPYEPKYWIGPIGPMSLCNNCGKDAKGHLLRHLLLLQCPHICPVWQLANSEPEAQSRPEAPETPEVPEDPIDLLIHRVNLTMEAVQEESVPLLSRVTALAILRQAKALERIADALEKCVPSLSQTEPNRNEAKLLRSAL